MRNRRFVKCAYYARMTLSVAVFWIVMVSLVATGAAAYVRIHGRSDALLALYVTLVIAANIVAAKTLAFDFGAVTLFAPGATLFFSVTFLLTDIVNERFGRVETQRMIYLAFVAQLSFLLFTHIALIATPAPFFTGQEAFEHVLGSIPRIAFAGLVTFLVSESLDAYLFQWFRRKTGERYLWVRNVFSSIPAMVIDSVLFVTLAFYGTMPIVPVMTGLVLIKWLVAVINIPFMYLSRYAMGTYTKPLM